MLAKANQDLDAAAAKRQKEFEDLMEKRKFKGKILGTDDGRIRLDMEGMQVMLDMNNVAKARLVPDYDNLFSKREESR